MQMEFNILQNRCNHNMKMVLQCRNFTSKYWLLEDILKIRLYVLIGRIFCTAIHFTHSISHQMRSVVSMYHLSKVGILD